ncbi:MAG: LamG-like jellyroll fold domain-containing protein [Bacteroidota bacterium]
MQDLRTLCGTVIALLLLTPLFTNGQPEPSTNGLIAYYPFGNGNADDASGHQHNGIIANAVSTTDVSGHANGALLFDGMTSLVRVDNVQDLALQTYTVAAFLRVDDLPSTGGILTKGKYYGNYSLEIENDSWYGWPIIIYQVSGGGNFETPLMNSSVPMNQFFHLAVTNDNGTIVIYINGLQCGTVNGPSCVTNNDPLYIGLGYNGGSNSMFFFKGVIDEVRIYNRVLDPTEISTIYNYGSPDPTLPLPIQLATITASVIHDNEVEVTWKTVSETNNYGFEINRKRGEKGEWMKIGFVEGHGTTLSPQSYSYVDRSATFGNYSYRIKQVDLDGKSKTFPEVEVAVGIGPDKFVLAQNYPNPFNPSTAIDFALPNKGYATLKLYNILGQEVATLFEGKAEAGRIYTAWFRASSLGSAVYFYRIVAGSFVETKKMILIVSSAI